MIHRDSELQGEQGESSVYMAGGDRASGEPRPADPQAWLNQPFLWACRGWGGAPLCTVEVLLGAAAWHKAF